MWFRVEFHRDGTIATCVEAASALVDGRRVIYVEADSKADAILRASDRYRAWLNKVKANRDATRSAKRERGECRECSRDAVAGRALCEGCEGKRRRRDRESWRRRAAGEPPRAPGAPGPRDRGPLEARREMTLLQSVLSAYDSNPRAFRKWLVGRIQELSGDLSGSSRSAAE